MNDCLHDDVYDVTAFGNRVDLAICADCYAYLRRDGNGPYEVIVTPGFGATFARLMISVTR